MISSAISAEPASSPNPDFSEIRRRRIEDNLRWMERLLDGYTLQGMVMLLLGGTDALSFRLRVAQTHVRHDMTPSSWSHVALVVEPNVRNPGRSRLVEISLDPATRFGWAPATNGVQTNVRLERYGDPAAFPNIAVVDLPPEPPGAEPERAPSTGTPPGDPRTEQRQKVNAALDRFMKNRGTLDCCDLIVQWLAFAWGAGQVPNPLVSGRGIPSAIMVETVAAATGFDLTPGIDSRLSCPEAVWQGAKWWYRFHDQVATRRLMGAYVVSHRLLG